MDKYFGSINDDSGGGILLLEELWHMCLNEFSRRPQRDLLELQIEEVNPACEDPGDSGLRHTKPICYVLLQQPKVKADQSEKELFHRC